MAIYYVRPDGNNSNAGTGPAANQAWQTLARIVQAGTAFTSGDTVYIAPGTYRQSITTTATYTSPTYFTGDPTASQFPGLTPGIVRITNFLTNDNSAATDQLLWGGVTFNYINISNIHFDHSTLNGGIYYTGTGNESSIKNCIFSGNGVSTGAIGAPAIRLNSIQNTLIENCIIVRSYLGMYIVTATGTDVNIDIRNCSIFGASAQGIYLVNSTNGGINITNNLFHFTRDNAVTFTGAGNSTAISYVTNNIIYHCVGSVSGGSSTNIIENYNRRIGSGGNTTVATGINTVTTGAPQFDFGHSALFNIALQKPFTSIAGSVNVGAGLSTYASTTDLYGQTWSTGASFPDIGCATAVQASGTSYYYPTERNASTITIAPGSTSQSIELYLGATGLTASTSGLAAYYNRTRTADVQIPLVARTIAQAWTAGGFAEVNASTMPGVYRLDLPDAAVAAGADDVTVVVRGASGTNGAVMTIKLSSGGLTAAQTASAILDAVGSSYVTAGSIGYAIQNSNVASISGSTTAADELEGALLHNGTDYINAQLIAGGNAGAGDVGGSIIQITEDPQEVTNISAWVNDWHTYVLRLVDENGTPYDITNDTLSVTYTNVATGSSYSFGGGSATITKQMNGQGIISILNPAAYPTAAVIRITIGATIGSTVRRFGPLQIEVLAP